jgi:hypothetical protein
MVARIAGKCLGHYLSKLSPSSPRIFYVRVEGGSADMTISIAGSLSRNIALKTGDNVERRGALFVEKDTGRVCEVFLLSASALSFQDAEGVLVRLSSQEAMETHIYKLKMAFGTWEIVEEVLGPAS